MVISAAGRLEHASVIVMNVALPHGECAVDGEEGKERRKFTSIQYNCEPPFEDVTK
jgi:hypothetical protein